MRDEDEYEVEPGVWSVLEGTRSFEVRIAWSDIRVDGRPLQVEIADPREWNPRAMRGLRSGIIHVEAPMPGKVIRLLVKVGDPVAAGQGVAIVEAMKMQNELKSPKEGRVAAIGVGENDTVNAGVVIVTLE